jgi:EmrB/QacA subfamily drug resistance transporter
MTFSRSSKNTLALAAVCLAALMFGLEISSVPAALPTLEKVLQGDLKDMQWIMNAYTVACTTVLMASGTLADRFGRKRIFILSLVVFGITSLLCGLAQNAPMLIASRFLQGLGAGAMIVTQVGILSHQFQDEEARGRAFAIWGIVFGSGLGFGPLIGGAIVALSNWQWVFLIHVPLTVLTLALVRGNVVESKDPKAKKLDGLGIVTLSLATFGLSYYIIQGRDFGLISPTGLIIIASTAACFITFLLVETFHSHPMFDFSVLKISNFSGAIMGSIGMNFSFWPLMIYLPLYFQVVLGYDTVAAGLALLAYTLPTLLFPPLGERLSLRYQPRIVIPLGMFVIGLGFMLMKYGSGVANASWLSMLPGALLAGTGLGLINTPVTNTTTGSVSSDRAGMASGIDLSARLISLAINIAVMGFILVEGISSYLRNALSGILDPDRLHALAEGMASGKVVSAERSLAELARLDTSAAVVHAALVHGFGLVMLYGGVCIWLLAAASFVIFGSRRVAAPASASEKPAAT